MWRGELLVKVWLAVGVCVEVGVVGGGLQRWCEAGGFDIDLWLLCF